MNTLFINTDGGSRGNPGPAAIGIVFADENNKTLHEYKEFIGQGTNNDAEYQAIVRALEILVKSKWFTENNSNDNEVICRLDSQLVVEQICGNWKIKKDHIQNYINRIRSIVEQIHLNISFVHIPREENSEADKLVNAALDEKLK